jgi:hypothetical protein
MTRETLNGGTLFSKTFLLKKKDDLFVILTVPHFKCQFPLGQKTKLNYIDHNCDTFSGICAIKISRLLFNLNIKNKLFFGDINRRECDLNREESKFTDFHKRLDNEIKKRQSQFSKLIVLDIHSGNFKEDIRLLILKQKNFCENGLRLLNLIHNYTNARIYLGGKANYICEKLSNENIPCLLLEFNESYNYSQLIFQQIGKAIKEYKNH